VFPYIVKPCIDIGSVVEKRKESQVFSLVNQRKCVNVDFPASDIDEVACRLIFGDGTDDLGELLRGLILEVGS
jgi:hypothetical protein